jgi:fermentation-respiration switch protein FrsA (DUF1100 family)
MKKIFYIVIIAFLSQSCINQKITQNELFNPVKEFELNSDFTFERDYIANSDTTMIETWWITESNPQFNLIYLSGNGTNVRSAVPFFNELGNQFNLNIFTFNYSGYGLSDGSPSVKGIVNDGKTSIDYFQKHYKNNDLPTIILGYSLGGFVALNIVNHNVVDQAIIMSSFTSIEELQDYLLKEALPGIVRPFLKLEIEESIYQLNNLALIEKTKKPILFIHGDADDFIPPAMSYRLFELSPSEDKHIAIIKNADHRMVLKDSESNKLVISEIKKFIRL